IFKLGTKFAHDLNLFFTNDQGQKKPVFMGCYGIGPGRLMGTIVEVSNDKNGIIWPKTVAPFAIHLLNLSGPDKEEFSNTVYSDLQNKGFEVLYDDRQESPGIKLKDADLIGLPARLIISNKTDQKVELKFRDEKKAELLTQEALFNKLTSAFRET
ncbi:MAG: His/Gly/Thr/Pro-type tRNA ligase C-terminal domain-containing protein, partial [Patescibacteria group bacterium]